tara:strand:- start:11377 stop:11982 length:606 start_codon:yes stop_codon:yes gene_type:complete
LVHFVNLSAFEFSKINLGFEWINMGNTFIALLRGINVGGQKKIKMAELRAVLEDEGLQNVKTYIQSGNIVFKSDETNREKLQNRIAGTIRQYFGFDVSTLVIREKDIRQILEANPFYNESAEGKLYYVLLRNPPEKELVQQLEQLHFDHEVFHITDTCVYLHCKGGYGKAKLNNNYIEKKLKVDATTRNERTMKKLLEMSA